jgi:Septum formation
MSVRRTAALGLLAAPALVAAILTSPAAAAPSDPHPAAIAPEAGTCWNYTYKQASRQSYTVTPVDCAEQHTVETVITLDVPKDIAAKGNNSRELVLWVDARCQVEVNRYAGVAKPDVAAPGTRTWYLWYTPTVKQWKSGAHWVSCAAASVPSDEKRRGKLVVVTGSIAGAADLSQPITFKTDYGTGTYAYRKPMTAIADRPYPGSKLQNRAASFCEKELGHKKFFWYGPSETEWVEGYTAVRCYSLKKS